MLGEQVRIGPYSIIEDNVTIGDETTIGNHTTICRGTTIGSRCTIYHSCSVGEAPQDLKYRGEQTHTKIGDMVIIREFVTINRGTVAYGITEIGDNTLLMAYVHIAHDCIVGHDVVFANLATLGGHVEIGDYASLGGGVLVHQFTRIGAHAFIGGGFRAVQDVPPFIMAQGEPLQYAGINSVGLRRRGFTPDDRRVLKKIYRLYFRSSLSRRAALDAITSEFPDHELAHSVRQFIAASDRGII